jgi:hypothetical protein
MESRGDGARDRWLTRSASFSMDAARVRIVFLALSGCRMWLRRRRA